MKDIKKDNDNSETFGSNVGEGIGCLMIAIAIGIILSFPRILDLIELAIKCHK